VIDGATGERERERERMHENWGAQYYNLYLLAAAVKNKRTFSLPQYKFYSPSSRPPAPAPALFDRLRGMQSERERVIFGIYVCGTLCCLMYINKTSIEVAFALLTFHTRISNKIQARLVDELSEGAVCVLVQPHWRVKLNDISCLQHHNSIAVEDGIEAVSNSEHCAVGERRSYCCLYELIRSEGALIIS
jgi:hypothetical protein